MKTMKTETGNETWKGLVRQNITRAAMTLVMMVMTLTAGAQTNKTAAGKAQTQKANGMRKTSGYDGDNPEGYVFVMASSGGISVSGYNPRESSGSSGSPGTASPEEPIQIEPLEGNDSGKTTTTLAVTVEKYDPETAEGSEPAPSFSVSKVLNDDSVKIENATVLTGGSVPRFDDAPSPGIVVPSLGYDASTPAPKSLWESIILIENGESITLQDLNQSQVCFICEGDATIILEGTNYLNFSGIYVPEGKTLTICGEGYLKVNAKENMAAIGGREGEACGNIIIEGGTISATGGHYAAAIGSGKNGSCGNIIIKNSISSVTAMAGDNAQHIGAGENGTCGTVSIDNNLDDETGGFYRLIKQGKKYDLWLGDKQVTALNRTDILDDGTASYDPETHTLTLDHPTTDFAIRSTGIDLTVTGYYKMSAAAGDAGVQVENGSLTLNGDLVLRGSTTGISAGGNVSVKGRVLAYGGTSAISQTGTLTLMPGFFAATRLEQSVGGGEPTVQIMAGTAIGDGSAEHPYEISGTAQWRMACEDVANGAPTAGKHFKCTSGFYALYTMGTVDNPFAGIIDGQRQYFFVQAAITTTKEGTALFPYVSGATIKNLLVNGNIVGGPGSAGIVGKAVGGTTTIDNCVFSGWVDPVYGKSAANWIVGAVADGATVTTTNCLDVSIQAWGDGRKAYMLTGEGQGLKLTKVGDAGVTWGDAIWAPKDAVLSFTVSNYTDVVASSDSELSVNEGVYSMTMPAEDVAIVPRGLLKRDVTVVVNEVGGVTGGTVTVSKNKATEGSYVLMTVTPDPYYLLKSLTVKDADNKDVVYDQYGLFRMPASAVTVTAEFVKKYNYENGVLTLKYGTFNMTDAFGEDITQHRDDVTKITADRGVRFTKGCVQLFGGFTECTEIDLSNVETSEMKSTSMMFSGCNNLEKLNLAGWNTSNVTDMSDMFYGCTSLRELDLSGFYFGIDTDVTQLFNACGVCKLTMPAGVAITSDMELRNGRYYRVYENTWVYSGWQKLGDKNVQSDVYDSSNNLISYAVFPAQTATSTFVWKEMPDDFVLELPDGKDNRDLIDLWDGMTVNVKLTGRTLHHDGNWNTLCLPFTLSNALNASYPALSGAEFKSLDIDGKYNGQGQEYFGGDEQNEADYTIQTGFDEDTGTLNLFFKDGDFEAGTPLLVKWESGEDIVSPTFDNVTITNTLNNTTSTDGKVQFLGNYDYRYFPAANRSLLFLGSGNTLFYPQTGARIGPSRSFFHVDLDGSADVRSFVLNFGDEETGISDAERLNDKGQMINDSWFSLDGRKLNAQPTARGIYLNNGRKVVVK